MTNHNIYSVIMAKKNENTPVPMRYVYFQLRKKKNI